VSFNGVMVMLIGLLRMPPSLLDFSTLALDMILAARKDARRCWEAGEADGLVYLAESAW